MSLPIMMSAPLVTSFSRASGTGFPCVAANPTTKRSEFCSRTALSMSVVGLSSMAVVPCPRRIFSLNGEKVVKPEPAAAMTSASESPACTRTSAPNSATVSTGRVFVPGSDLPRLAATTVTCAPWRTASRAMASPILPEERFPIKRTLSIGSRVPPAVSRKRIPLIRPPSPPRSPATTSSASTMALPPPRITPNPSLTKIAKFSRTAALTAVPAAGSGTTKGRGIPAASPAGPSPRPRASLAMVAAVAGAKRTASGASEGSSTSVTGAGNAADPTNCWVSGSRITSTRWPTVAISRATLGTSRAPREDPTESRIKGALGRALALVGRRTGVDHGRFGNARTTWGADKVVPVGRPNFLRHALRRLAEAHLQLVLAQLLDGDAQGMLGAGVDLRAGDTQGIVQAQGGGVLVDLTGSLCTRYHEPITGIHLAQ